MIACSTETFAQNEAAQFPVATKTLKNGMNVLVQTDHSIPNVALYIFYRIGSRNEHPGTTGLSHFFEHMMFNGAKKFGPGELDKAMEANGAANNAYTNENTTVYQDWFPRSALKLISFIVRLSCWCAFYAILPARLLHAVFSFAGQQFNGLARSGFPSSATESKPPLPRRR